MISRSILLSLGLLCLICIAQVASVDEEIVKKEIEPLVEDEGIMKRDEKVARSRRFWGLGYGGFGYGYGLGMGWPYYGGFWGKKKRSVETEDIEKKDVEEVEVLERDAEDDEYENDDVTERKRRFWGLGYGYGGLGYGYGLGMGWPYYGGFWGKKRSVEEEVMKKDIDTEMVDDVITTRKVKRDADIVEDSVITKKFADAEMPVVKKDDDETFMRKRRFWGLGYGYGMGMGYGYPFYGGYWGKKKRSISKRQWSSGNNFNNNNANGGGGWGGNNFNNNNANGGGGNNFNNNNGR